MNIVMFGHKYIPSREGGVEIVVEELSTRMADMNNHVLVLNRRRKQYLQSSLFNGVELHTINTIDKKSLDAVIYDFNSTLYIKKLIKKGKVDVVHVHTEGACLFLPLLSKIRNRRFKIVVTIHGLDWQRNKWGHFASKILLKGEKMACKYADDIIVLSKNMQHYFLKKYNREALFIPNGMSYGVLKEPNIINKKYSLKKREYILFLARLVPEKNVDCLIDAWKQIPVIDRQNLKLVIAGGSSHTNKYFEHIQDAVKGDESIIMTGHVEGDELVELYSNAKLYVLSSNLEGMPISLLEAMSYGLPCIVSNIPECTEVINQNCISFEKGDSIDLKNKIMQFINSKLSYTPYIAYSWNDVVDKTLSVYKKGDFLR